MLELSSSFNRSKNCSRLSTSSSKNDRVRVVNQAKRNIKNFKSTKYSLPWLLKLT